MSRGAHELRRSRSTLILLGATVLLAPFAGDQPLVELEEESYLFAWSIEAIVPDDDDDRFAHDDLGGDPMVCGTAFGDQDEPGGFCGATFGDGEEPPHCFEPGRTDREACLRAELAATVAALDAGVDPDEFVQPVRWPPPAITLALPRALSADTRSPTTIIMWWGGGGTRTAPAR